MKKEKEIVIFDSTRDLDEDIQEHCRVNERVVERGSQEYYDIENHIRDIDAEDFRNDACWRFKLGWCLVRGYAGLWNGSHAGGELIHADSGADMMFQDNVDDVKVAIEDDGLVVYGYHHDGTNRYVVRQLTERGAKYVENLGIRNCKFKKEIHDKLLRGNMTRKITLKMIQP